MYLFLSADLSIANRWHAPIKVPISYSLLSFSALLWQLEIHKKS